MPLFLLRSIILISLCCLPQAIFAAQLRVLVLDGDQMPWMQVEKGKLNAGLYADLGVALAQKMRRKVSFTILPRKRLALALEKGSADLICNYIPAWMPGAFDWSVGFIPNTELLISAQSANKPDSLAEFAHVRIGTVLGYAYLELDQILGKYFLRDDAPTMHNNLLKLAAGRIQHLVINQFELEYQQRLGLFKTPLHPYTVLRAYKGQCAVSRVGQVSVAEVNRAIALLQSSHELAQIMGKYR
ncbi:MULTISPECIES: ABC transporter substrate-binding protein [unclassified Iodobacter]|uniref:substrate-binding periplasmic protein n=1 Tax=unclassified Iodobacter TaxID=235634 RepID=UPI0025EA44C4|nr:MULTISPECIES: transporter substrate-binding domain-containing protein [unclassified Iodobacter]MDW5418595.1 transporter substrate-binding domain-containing protein [Iodobacter sp. CM08]